MEDGKYLALTEDQEPAIFMPSMLYHDPQSYLIVRSKRDPQQLAALMRFNLRQLDSGLPVDIQSWNQLLEVVQFPAARGHHGAGRARPHRRNPFHHRHLRHGGVFGVQAAEGTGHPRGAGSPPPQVLATALGRALRLLAAGSAAGLALGILASRVLSYIVYQATPRDPLVLAGVVSAMALLGLLATWLPAQRALHVDPHACCCVKNDRVQLLQPEPLPHQPLQPRPVNQVERQFLVRKHSQRHPPRIRHHL